MKKNNFSIVPTKEAIEVRLSAIESIKTRIKSMHAHPNADAWTKLTVEYMRKFMIRTGQISCPIEIPYSKLVIPNLQRKRRGDVVSKIKRNYNPLLEEYIIVNYNPETGEWELLDGQHTLAALLEMGIISGTAKCYYGLTNEEKVEIFTSQYKKKTRVTPTDEFYIYRAAGMEPAVGISRICEKWGVVVGEKRGTPKNVTSIRKLIKIYETYGAEGLDFCFKVIFDSGWENDYKAFTEGGMNIGFFAYEKCKNSEVAYATLISLLNQYEFVTDFITRISVDYNVVSSKHPESCVGMAINDILA